MAATQPVKKAAKQKKVVAEMVKDYKFRILAFVNEDVFQFLCSECERGGFSLPQRCALELRDDCFMIEFDSIDKTPIVFFVQNDVSYFLCEPILIVDDATTFSPFKIQSIALDDPEKEELRKYLHNRRVALAKGAKLPAVDYRRLLFIATCQSNPDDADGPSIFGCFVGAEDGADDTKLFVSPISDFIEAFQEKMVSEGDTVAFETMMTSIYDIITKNRTEKTLPDTDVCTWRLQQKLPFIYLLLLWDPVNERIRTYIGSAQSNTRFQPGMKSNTSSHIVYAARIYQNTHDSSFYTSPYKLDDFLIAASYQHNLDTKDREGDSSTDYPIVGGYVFILEYVPKDENLRSRESHYSNLFGLNQKGNFPYITNQQLIVKDRCRCDPCLASITILMSVPEREEALAKLEASRVRIKK